MHTCCYRCFVILSSGFFLVLSVFKSAQQAVNHKHGMIVCIKDHRDGGFRNFSHACVVTWANVLVDISLLLICVLALNCVQLSHGCRLTAKLIFFRVSLKFNFCLAALCMQPPVLFWWSSGGLMLRAVKLSLYRTNSRITDRISENKFLIWWDYFCVFCVPVNHMAKANISGKCVVSSFSNILGFSHSCKGRQLHRRHRRNRSCVPLPGVILIWVYAQVPPLDLMHCGSKEVPCPY